MRIRNLIRGITALAVVLLGGTLLTACSEEPAVTAGYAFVVGMRANSAVPEAAALTGQLPERLAEDSRVTLTGISGQPNGVPGGSWKVIDYGNSVDNAEAILGLRSKLRVGIEQLRSDSPEADVLGAIAAAARSIADLDVKHVVIADSLISTAGALRFQDSALLEALGEDVAAGIAAVDLPTLHGYTVLIAGAGSTAAPQPQLPQRDQVALRDIWRTVLTVAGAADVQFLDSITIAQVGEALPEVSIVEPSEVTGPVIDAAACEVVVPQTSVRFYGDSAEFVSPETAQQEFTAVAAMLSGCRGTVTISGTTASPGDRDSQISLSVERAAAARAVLAPLMGVPVDEITVQGLGFVGQPDTDDSGRLIESLAAANRTIIITVE